MMSLIQLQLFWFYPFFFFFYCSSWVQQSFRGIFFQVQHILATCIIWWICPCKQRTATGFTQFLYVYFHLSVSTGVARLHLFVFRGSSLSLFVSFSFAMLPLLRKAHPLRAGLPPSGEVWLWYMRVLTKKETHGDINICELETHLLQYQWRGSKCHFTQGHAEINKQINRL